MKKIKTLSNSFVLQDVDSSGKIIHQQGYKKGGLTYKIENGNIKFYLYQDYFYKNVVWSADLPLQVDGVSYDANTIADGIKKIFKFETDPADTEFNADSEMPISNASVTNKFNAIDATISGLKKKDEQLTTEVNSKASEASVTALQGLVDTKANAGDSYTKAESDDKYALKNQVPTDVYTKKETDDKLALKADKSELSDYALKGEIPTDVYTKSETDDKLALKADKSEIPSLTGYATEEWVNNQGYLKEHQDLSNYATKADLNKKQDVLVSGQNIKTINGQDIFGSGDITIESNGVKKWEGTRAEYNALGTYDENTLYIITDEDVEYALKSDLDKKQDKGDYALKSEIPTVPSKVSAFQNDAGYLTEHQALSSYATKDELDNKQDKGDYALKSEIPTVPSKVSAFQNDAGYLTEHQDISNLATKDELADKQDKGNYALKTDIPVVPTKVSSFENDAGYLTEHQDLSNYALKTEIPVVPSKVSAFENDKGYLTEHQDISNLATKTELSTKQDKGDYALKTEIPTVPSKVSAFENDKGYLTEHQDISGLATKTELNGKQDALVSGTNLKTINGQSLLGNGDITITGGASLPISSDNVNYTNSSSTKTLTQVLNNTEEITFTLEDGSTVTKKFILG